MLFECNIDGFKAQRTQAIVEQPNLHARLGPRAQGIEKAVPGLVVLDDVVLGPDGVLGARKSMLDLPEGFLVFDQELDLVLGAGTQTGQLAHQARDLLLPRVGKRVRKNGLRWPSEGRGFSSHRAPDAGIGKQQVRRRAHAREGNDGKNPGECAGHAVTTDERANDGDHVQRDQRQPKPPEAKFGQAIGQGIHARWSPVVRRGQIATSNMVFCIHRQRAWRASGVEELSRNWIGLQKPSQSLVLGAATSDDHAGFVEV
jgi:hypothetical protein